MPSSAVSLGTYVACGLRALAAEKGVGTERLARSVTGLLAVAADAPEMVPAVLDELVAVLVQLDEEQERVQAPAEGPDVAEKLRTWVKVALPFVRRVCSKGSDGCLGPFGAHAQCDSLVFSVVSHAFPSQHAKEPLRLLALAYSLHPDKDWLPTSIKKMVFEASLEISGGDLATRQRSLKILVAVLARLASVLDSSAVARTAAREILVSLNDLIMKHSNGLKNKIDDGNGGKADAAVLRVLREAFIQLSHLVCRPMCGNFVEGMREIHALRDLQLPAFEEIHDSAFGDDSRFFCASAVLGLPWSEGYGRRARSEQCDGSGSDSQGSDIACECHGDARDMQLYNGYLLASRVEALQDEPEDGGVVMSGQEASQGVASGSEVAATSDNAAAAVKGSDHGNGSYPNTAMQEKVEDSGTLALATPAEHHTDAMLEAINAAGEAPLVPANHIPKVLSPAKSEVKEVVIMPHTSGALHATPPHSPLQTDEDLYLAGHGHLQSQATFHQINHQPDSAVNFFLDLIEDDTWEEGMDIAKLDWSTAYPQGQAGASTFAHATSTPVSAVLPSIVPPSALPPAAVPSAAVPPGFPSLGSYPGTSAGALAPPTGAMMSGPSMMSLLVDGMDAARPSLNPHAAIGGSSSMNANGRSWQEDPRLMMGGHAAGDVVDPTGSMYLEIDFNDGATSSQSASGHRYSPADDLTPSSFGFTSASSSTFSRTAEYNNARLRMQEQSRRKAAMPLHETVQRAEKKAKVEDEDVIEEPAPILCIIAGKAVSEDIMIKILSELAVADLLRLAMVNRQFRKLASDDRLWEVIYDRRWILPPARPRHQKGSRAVMSWKQAYSQRARVGEDARTCDICGKAFLFASEVIKHQQSHKLAFPCEQPGCGAGFSNQAALLRHLAREHSGLQCATCGHRFSSSEAKLNHEARKHGCKVHSCTEPGCRASFAWPFQLRMHQVSVHGAESPFKCETCNRTFLSRSKLKEHAAVHLPAAQRLIMCGLPGCSRGALHMEGVLMHWKETGHPMRCIHLRCQEIFSDEDSLRNHLKGHRKPCSFCNEWLVPGKWGRHPQTRERMCYDCKEKMIVDTKTSPLAVSS